MSTETPCYKYPQRHRQSILCYTTKPIGCKKMAWRSLLAVSCLILFSNVAFPQQESPELKLSLRESVEIALGRNLSLQIERLNVDVFETYIQENSAIFDHVWNAGYTRQDFEIPNTNPFQGGGESGGIQSPAEDPVLIDLLRQGITLSEFMDLFGFEEMFRPSGPVRITEYSEEHDRFDTGISKQFRWGTRYDLSVLLDRHETSNPYEGLNPASDTELRLTITQPLLRNFGTEANLFHVRTSENDLEISKAELRAKVMDVVFDVLSAYWTLILRQEQLLIQQESLRLAQDLLVNNTKRVEAGVLAPIEILSASAGVAARREAVIVAENNVVDAEDSLKRILELREKDSLWDVHIVPTDEPEYVHQAIDIQKSMRLAKEWRPEFDRLDLTIENNELTVDYAENQLRPQLDFSVGAWTSGLGDDTGDSFDLMNDTEFVSYTAALQFSYPLGNQAAKARLKRARLQSQQAEKSLEDLHRAVELQIRNACRQIETNRQRIEANEVAVELAEERLRAEEEALRVGMSTSHDVLDFQEDLTIARGQHTQSVIDHIISRAQLEYVQGTLPESLGFQLRRPDSDE